MSAPVRSSGPITNIAPASPVRRGLPIFTFAILAANIVIYVLVSSLPYREVDKIYFDYALMPAAVSSGAPDALITLVTHAFLHASWGHVMANSYALFLFGLLSERFLGTFRVVLVYFASAIGGGLLFIALAPYSYVQLVGASGAISGLFGAAIVAAPQSARKSLMINAVVWLALNVGLPAVSAAGSGPRIAWEAHLGGFVVGVVLGWILRASMPRAVIGIQPATADPANPIQPPKPEPFNPVQRR